MILTFSKPELVEAIQTGQKIHTIRKDTHQRWKPGMTIHLYKGNPRNNGKPFWIDDQNRSEPRCTAVQEIRIRHSEAKTTGPLLFIIIDSIMLFDHEVPILAQNDGLSFDDFVRWFVPNPGDEFRGRIIHWSGKTYPDLFTDCETINAQQP